MGVACAVEVFWVIFFVIVMFYNLTFIYIDRDK